MEVIEALRRLGYQLEADGSHIRFRFMKPGRPPSEARRLLEELQARKAEALTHLTAWPGPCYCCGETCWWLHRDGGSPICGRCHPPACPEQVRAWMPQAACRWTG